MPTKWVIVCVIAAATAFFALGFALNSGSDSTPAACQLALQRVGPMLAHPDEWKYIGPYREAHDDCLGIPLTPAQRRAYRTGN